MKNKNTVLLEVFGYGSFRPGQEDIIDALLSGRDVLGIMPTGAGKSLCYQVPALLLPGITVVVSPLISLMCDQVKALNRKHVHAAWLNSSLTPRQLRKAYLLAAEGVYKLIYLSPERLQTPAFLSFAQSVTISMVCVDEAHCVSQWGEQFRPEYRKIPEFISRLAVRPIVCAFTATATASVRDDILRFLDLRNPFCMTSGFDRPNLYFEVAEPKNKFRALTFLLEKYRGRCGVVYCLTRRCVETVAKQLEQAGNSVVFYHGGMSKEEREASQTSWLSGEAPVIVATNAFGMGIDKPNVRFVIHYNMPGDMEEYYQEAGRAGRDGLPADCILLYSYRDVVINEFFLKQAGSEPATGTLRRCAHQKREKLHAMMRYAGRKICLRAFMLEYFGEKADHFCGKCSVCLSEADPHPAGEKALSFFRSSEEEDPELYRHLRSLRLRLSSAYHKLPAEIFQDPVLHRLAVSVPVTWIDLFLISGMDPLRCIKYGAEFLFELRAWKDSH